MKPFIAIYGIDGTGKTSTALSLCKRLDELGHGVVNYNKYKKTTNNPTDALKKQGIKRLSPDLQLGIYLVSLLHHTEVINSLCQESFVVKDRYFDDVLAHHAHLGATPELLDYVRGAPIKRPDLRVILIASEEIRQKRVSKRHDATKEDTEKAVPGSRLYFMQREYLKGSKGPTIILDTGDNNLEEITISILKKLETFGHLAL